LPEYKSADISGVELETNIHFGGFEG